MTPRETTNVPAATTEMEAARGVVAEAIGEQPENVKIQRPRWMELMTQGVIVELHIGRWRAEEQLGVKDLAAELGVEVTSAAELEHIKQFLALGAKRLLPESVIRAADNADTALRTQLELYSYKTGWGRFVPATTYRAWKAAHEKKVAEYYAIRDDIIARYDELHQLVLTSYEQQARTVWERLSRAGTPPAQPQEEFAREFAARVAAKIRTKERIREQFYVTIELSYIPLPALLSGESAAELGQQMTEWTLAKLDEQAIAQRREQLDEMNRDVAEAIRKQKEEQVDSFMRSIVSRLRNDVYDTVLDALDGIKKGGKTLGARAKGLRTFIEKISALNFYGDAELETKLSELAALLGPAGATPSIEQVQQSLEELGTLARYTIMQLGETPRSGRSGAEVGVPDAPDIKAVRKLRASAGITGSVLDALEIKPLRAKRAVA